MKHGFTLLQKQKFKDGEGEGDGGTGGGSNGDNTNVDPSKNNPPGDGGTKTTDREAELLKEVMKRKGNEQKLAGEISDLKGALSKFEGIDPEAVRNLLTEKADRERTELEKRGEFDKVKAQMVEQHQGEVSKLKTDFESEVGTLKGQLASATSQIVELTIGRSFGDSPFVRETLTLTPAKARVVYGSHFELQDGKVVAYDKPAGADGRTPLVDGSGNSLAFDAAIEKIVKADPDHEHLIRSKIKQGAGSNNDQNAKATEQAAAGRDRIAAAMRGGALTFPK